MFDVIEGGLPPKELDGDGVAIVAKALRRCMRVVRDEIEDYAESGGHGAARDRVELGKRCGQLCRAMQSLATMQPAAYQALEENLRGRGIQLADVRRCSEEFKSQAEYTQAYEEACELGRKLGRAIIELAVVAGQRYPRD